MPPVKGTSQVLSLGTRDLGALNFDILYIKFGQRSEFFADFLVCELCGTTEVMPVLSGSGSRSLLIKVRRF